jgi:hypothetical protein
MNLFKVFPGFGAMILGQPLEQTTYSLSAHLIGWLYHFSNGATFGVMYLAMVGDATRRHWTWAILMAVALELGMLLTPYPQVFGIAVTPRFVVVTMAAHAIFGVILGLSVKWLAGADARFPLTPARSPGQRKNRRQRTGESEAVGILGSRAACLPLPKGDGVVGNRATAYAGRRP